MVSFIAEKESKLAELYAAYVVETRRLAYLLTGSREAADDLTQDAFIKSFGRLAYLRDKNNFGPYLRKTVVNLAKMQYRRRAVERRHLEAESRDLRSGSAEIQVDDSLESALMGIPYRQRAAIVLRYYVDLTDEQIGDILGCALGTVRSLVSRGLASLRDGMEEDSDG